MIPCSQNAWQWLPVLIFCSLGSCILFFFLLTNHKITLLSVPQALHRTYIQGKHLELVLTQIMSTRCIGTIVSPSLLPAEGKSASEMVGPSAMGRPMIYTGRLLEVSKNLFQSNIIRSVMGSECHQEFQFKVQSLYLSNFI